MNPSSSGSSNLLFQSGGGLQSAGTPQSSGSTVQPNQSSLFSGGQETGRQDLLGSGTVVGTVEYDKPLHARQTAAAQSDQSPQSAAWTDPLILGVIIVVAVVFGYMVYKILREG